MRPLEQRRTVGFLADAGLNAADIAYIAAVPRSTVRDWLWPRYVPRRPTPVEMCPRCGHPLHDFGGLPESEYAYLLGFYLGDGAISAGRKDVYALRIVSDQRYVAVLAECALAMAVVMPKNRVGFIQREGCVEIKSLSKSWPCLFPQHGPGRKHERRIALADWQEEIVRHRPQQFVRGLLHSDGCRITNFAISKRYGRYEYPRYFFNNDSDDIRELLCAALRQLGIAYTTPKPLVVSIARADSVRLLDGFVGPKA